MNDVRPPRRMDALRDAVRARVEQLQAAFLSDQSAAAAALARLRRCDPTEVGADPRVWSLTVADLPEQLTDLRADSPTRAERAVHATMVLYAIHQQSHRSEPAHRRDFRLGSAVRQLARARGADGEPDSSVVQRFHQVSLAQNWEARLHHLQGLITLMRGEDPIIGVDYGLLAVDLNRLDDPRANHAFVLTRWGRDLHTTPKTTTKETP